MSLTGYMLPRVMQVPTWQNLSSAQLKGQKRKQNCTWICSVKRQVQKKRYVQGWLPIVAAAQLAYKRPEEKDLLESWINVFEYQ